MRLEVFQLISFQCLFSAESFNIGKMREFLSGRQKLRKIQRLLFCIQNRMQGKALVDETSVSVLISGSSVVPFMRKSFAVFDVT